MSLRAYRLLAVASLVICFGLAARLARQYQGWRGNRATGDFFTVLLGDSRAMFAGTFFKKADAYYHSGFYPTMFDDNAAFQTAHMAEDTGAVNSRNHGDELGFLGPKRNWIDALGRHFIPNHHSHLDEGGADNLGGSAAVGEILPWLKLSADLDPENVQTYTVTAFWLRERMQNVAEADAVLHEGLRNCPNSYEIFFELGRLYYESHHDHDRARNVWEHGVCLWLQLDPRTPQGKIPAMDLVTGWLNRPFKLAAEQEENQLVMEQLTTHLAQLETEDGNWLRAIQWFQAAQKVTLSPHQIQERIDQLRFKLGQELNPLLKPLY